MATLLSHTHGRHVPHLTLASLTSYDLDAVRAALSALPPAEPFVSRVGGLGIFPRSRVWLAPAVTSSLLREQERVVDAVLATGADVHPHYRSGTWLPHLTLAPRLRLDQLPVVAGKVNEVMPLTAAFPRLALVSTRTGEVVTLGPGS